MINFYLKTFDDVKNLTSLCDAYKENIDVIYGRYIIDGKSYLGVSSLVGNHVSIDIITDDESVKHDFANKLDQFKGEK